MKLNGCIVWVVYPTTCSSSQSMDVLLVKKSKQSDRELRGDFGKRIWFSAEDVAFSDCFLTGY